MNYTVFFIWDDEADAWVATIPDIIGLVLESDSLDTLMKRAKEAVTELLELNSQKPANVISYVCNRTQTMVYA